jgi:hypothetical protein
MCFGQHRHSRLSLGTTIDLQMLSANGSYRYPLPDASFTKTSWESDRRCLAHGQATHTRQSRMRVYANVIIRGRIKSACIAQSGVLLAPAKIAETVESKPAVGNVGLAGTFRTATLPISVYMVERLLG